MKKVMVLYGILMISMPYCVYAQTNKDIEPYVDFLGQERKTAKDYILSLFKDRDMVVLCERDHRDLTQYDLILDVIRDPYFIDHAGAVYTEVGAFNLNPALNRFLQNPRLSEEEINQQVLKFQQDCAFPLWEKSNFAHFVRRLHEINTRLPDEKKIAHYPTDVFYVEGEPDSVKVRSMLMNMMHRDSIMADRIIRLFEKQKQETSRKKALVIMNYRHAFKRDTPAPNDMVVVNTGRILSETYADKLATVLVHNYRTRPGSLIQDGKWDAAFQYLKIDNVGYDFKDSPFGKDSFDLWPWPMSQDFTYADIFDGFVFYLPFEQWQIAKGFPGLMANGFYEEYARRVNWFNKAAGREIEPLQSEEEMMRYNDVHISKVEELDKMKEIIAKWFYAK
jgi:hypothetical protein